jgi:hypothetical protein
VYTIDEIARIFKENLISPLKIELIEGDYYVSGRRARIPEELTPMPALFVTRFEGDVILHPVDRPISSGEQFSLNCSAINTGNIVWRNIDGDFLNHVQLGVSLIKEGRIIVRDFARAALPRYLHPGQRVDLAVTCPAITEPGQYSLLVDMVNEGNFWFHTRSSIPVEHHPLTVV